MTRRKEAGLINVRKDLSLRRLKNERTDASNDEVTYTNRRKRRLIADDDDSGEDDGIAFPVSSFVPDPKRCTTVAEGDAREESEDTKGDSTP
jgi:hypothetical protein